MRSEQPAKIHVLPPQVAERIAAGEVIERPASVVKELVENGIDAGATEIFVSLSDGGKSHIEIVDNGHGMSPRDLALSVRRHATSKLSTLDDLERIATLGFRGEALPSIAAVSDLSILSRTPGATDAYELHASRPGERSIEPEVATFGHFNGSTHGTRMSATGLFSQVPARLKFLKAQSSEVAQVREWLERLALAHPEVGFQFESDGRSVLKLRPESEPNRVRSVLAGGEDFPVISAQNVERGASIRIHWIQGLSVGQPRKLSQVINGRAIKDRMLQQAILRPFRQALLPGQYPVVALFLEVDASRIDVNVHPTKTEVRFLDGSAIFQQVARLLETLIATHGSIGFVGRSTDASGSVASNLWRAADSASASTQNWRTLLETGVANHSPNSRSTNFASIDSIDRSASGGSSVQQAHLLGPDADHHLLSHAQFQGVVFNTYLVYESADNLILVDQHAADERVRYERLRARLARGEIESQALLVPESVQFDPDDRPRIEQNLLLLDRIGFQVEIFGDSSLLFRGIPAEWGMSDLKPRLASLIDRLKVEMGTTSNDRAQASLHPNDLLIDESLFERLASQACHSSVRAGDRLDREQAQALTDSLFKTAHPWNCPHGRPTVTRVPRTRLEEWFQRRVE